jgi:hypothetical protein
MITKVTKVYKNHLGDVNPWSRLDRETAFKVELECLNRLNINYVNIYDGKEFHFPELIHSDASEYMFKLSDCGTGLFWLQNNITISNIHNQLDCIVWNLQFNNIIYLDNHTSGKNLCLNAAGIISLIDFDGCVIDGDFKSPIMEKIFIEKYHGDISYYYERLKVDMYDIISNNSYINLKH